MKFSIKGFFNKCDQIRWKLRIWLHLMKKALMENFSFCAMRFPTSKFKQKVSYQTVTGKSKLKQKKTHVECQYVFGFDRNQWFNSD